MELFRVIQMKNAYVKIYDATRSSLRDTSRLRMSNFNHIWSEDHESRTHPTCPCRAFDCLFSSKEPWLEFLKFRTFEVGGAEETSVFTFICLDAIITGSVDNLPPPILNTSSILKTVAKRPCASVSCKGEKAVCENQSSSMKGGIIVGLFLKDRPKSSNPFSHCHLYSCSIIFTALFLKHFRQAMKPFSLSSLWPKMR